MAELRGTRLPAHAGEDDPLARIRARHRFKRRPRGGPCEGCTLLAEIDRLRAENAELRLVLEKKR